jgi:hypothetical protein
VSRSIASPRRTPDETVLHALGIATPFASKFLLERQPDGSNHRFTEAEIKQFEDDPEFYFDWRKELDSELNVCYLLLGIGTRLFIIITVRSWSNVGRPPDSARCCESFSGTDGTEVTEEAMDSRSS